MMLLIWYFVLALFIRLRICFSLCAVIRSELWICGSIRCPFKSSSQVTWKISASTGIKDRSGNASSRSQRLTALSETQSFSASSRCVSPLALRRAAMNAPIVFFSIQFTSWIHFAMAIALPWFYQCGGEKGRTQSENYSRWARIGPVEDSTGPIDYFSYLPLRRLGR